jgi:hypothetical protein
MYFPALAAAALAAIAILLVFWVQQRTDTPGVLRASLPGAASGAAAVSARFTFVVMRGSSTYDLDLPAAGSIEFRASPVSRAAGARFGLTLTRLQAGGGEEALGSLTGLVPDADGYLHAYADAARLSSGRYSLRVEPLDKSAATSQSFPFELHAR